ncbi:MAG: diheme cytochrome c-553 [Thermoanaerobaculia bacterium]
MRRAISVAAAALAAIFLRSAVARLSGADANANPAKPEAGARLGRGKYLVTIQGCDDCHTPWKMGESGLPEPDMTRRLSGHPEAMKMPPPPATSGPWIWSGAATNTAFAGPWGVTYASNLTPEQNTGFGIWTEEMFVKAMRTGKHFGTSRPIQPPMPWANYSKMTDEDLRCVFVYLRTVPPIVNHVPDYEEPPPPKK